jgi:hypothetical protein
MPSSGVWRRVDLIRSGVSEEHIASILIVELTRELGTLLTVTYKLNHTAKKH